MDYDDLRRAALALPVDKRRALGEELIESADAATKIHRLYVVGSAFLDTAELDKALSGLAASVHTVVEANDEGRVALTLYAEVADLSAAHDPVTQRLWEAVRTWVEPSIDDIRAYSADVVLTGVPGAIVVAPKMRDKDAVALQFHLQAGLRRQVHYHPLPDDVPFGPVFVFTGPDAPNQLAEKVQKAWGQRPAEQLRISEVPFFEEFLRMCGSRDAVFSHAYGLLGMGEYHPPAPSHAGGMSVVPSATLILPKGDAPYVVGSDGRPLGASCFIALRPNRDQGQQNWGELDVMAIDEVDKGWAKSPGHVRVAEGVAVPVLSTSSWGRPGVADWRVAASCAVNRLPRDREGPLTPSNLWPIERTVGIGSLVPIGELAPGPTGFPVLTMRRNGDVLRPGRAVIVTAGAAETLFDDPWSMRIGTLKQFGDHWQFEPSQGPWLAASEQVYLVRSMN